MNRGRPAWWHLRSPYGLPPLPPCLKSDPCDYDLKMVVVLFPQLISYPPYTNFTMGRCLTYIDTEGILCCRKQS